MRVSMMRHSTFLTCLFWAVALAPPATADRCIRGPYLQDARESGITVRWELDRLGPSSLEYGKAGEKRRRVECHFRGRKHRVRLTDLQPGERYRYRIFSGRRPVT